MHYTGVLTRVKTSIKIDALEISKPSNFGYKFHMEYTFTYLEYLYFSSCYCQEMIEHDTMKQPIMLDLQRTVDVQINRHLHASEYLF